MTLLVSLELHSFKSCKCQLTCCCPWALKLVFHSNRHLSPCCWHRNWKQCPLEKCHSWYYFYFLFFRLGCLNWCRRQLCARTKLVSNMALVWTAGYQTFRAGCKLYERNPHNPLIYTCTLGTYLCDTRLLCDCSQLVKSCTPPISR